MSIVAAALKRLHEADKSVEILTEGNIALIWERAPLALNPDTLEGPEAEPPPQAADQGRVDVCDFRATTSADG